MLLVDAGNSRLKWAFLLENNLSLQFAVFYEKRDKATVVIDVLKSQSQSARKIQQVRLVHVLGSVFETKVVEFCKYAKIKLEIIHAVAELAGVKSAYLEPEKLGVDRLVGLIAGHHLYKNRSVIIVDCGTAITIDALDQYGQHDGGIILPGIRLCHESLTAGTDIRVELKTNSKHKSLQPTIFANNTIGGIESGCILGLSAAIDDICRKMEQNMMSRMGSKKIIRVLCGGDAESFYPLLSEHYQLKVDLLMRGLAYINKS